VVPTYFLTLTRSVPAPYMSVEDLDEVDAEDYVRAVYANDGSTWTLSLDTLANAQEVTWPVAAADWGDVTGWALLDTPDVGTGRILYGGDLATTWTITADTQPIMEPGQLSVSISVSDWALEA
jgi:hypothetical protein